jgi:hypothetical protein
LLPWRGSANQVSFEELFEEFRGITTLFKALIDEALDAAVEQPENDPLGPTDPSSHKCSVPDFKINNKKHEAKLEPAGTPWNPGQVPIWPSE